MENYRTFIAVELPQDVKNSLRALQDEMRKTGADAKWVKPENMHLTLQFIGSTPAEKVAGICEKLKGRVREFGTFRLSFTGLGVFPANGRPKVVWAGISEGSENISALARMIGDSLSGLGFAAEERSFVPHLTLGRIRSSVMPEKLLGFVASRKKEGFCAMEVSGVSLIKSSLGPEGPVYTVLEKVLF